MMSDNDLKEKLPKEAYQSKSFLEARPGQPAKPPKHLLEGVHYHALPKSIPVSNLAQKVIQVLCTGIWEFQLLASLLGPMVFFIYGILFWPITRVFMLIYIGWMVYDQGSAHTGLAPNRIRTWVRQNVLWDYFRAYFPAQLVKTEELDPSRKYIIGFHPHGILFISHPGVYAISLFANVIFNRNFNLLFPGINTIMCTLPANFWFPLWRDYALILGSGTCTSSSIKYRLSHGAPGTSMIIAIGGAEEFRYMKNGTMDLVIAKRKGFVKLALTTGSSLVPILGFGENEIFHPITHPGLQPLHNLFRFFLKSSAPLFIGQYGTLMPHNSPLTSVGKFRSQELI
jgi:hypothetical protein